MDPMPMSVEDLVALTRNLPTAARCLNRECRKKCTRRPGMQGRQKVFCSNACRLTYFRERHALLGAWARVDATISADTRPMSERELRKLQKWVEWLLLRYDVDDPSAASRAAAVRPSHAP
jgi:hypothetical protein